MHGLFAISWFPVLCSPAQFQSSCARTDAPLTRLQMMRAAIMDRFSIKHCQEQNQYDYFTLISTITKWIKTFSYLHIAWFNTAHYILTGSWWFNAVLHTKEQRPSEINIEKYQWMTLNKWQIQLFTSIHLMSWNDFIRSSRSSRETGNASWLGGVVLSFQMQTSI